MYRYFDTGVSLVYCVYNLIVSVPKTDGLDKYPKITMGWNKALLAPAAHPCAQQILLQLVVVTSSTITLVKSKTFA
jgi:hypothetical protein